MHLRFLHACSWLDGSYLFVLNNIPLSRCTTVYLSVHLLKDNFQVLAVVNKATINICVQAFFFFLTMPHGLQDLSSPTRD